VRGALPDGFSSYLAYVMPGIVVQSTTFRMTQTAVGLAEDLERGVIDRIRSMPVARFAVPRSSPVTATADAARALAVTGPIVEPVTRTLIWSAALLAVFVPLSVARRPSAASSSAPRAQK
jgi:hypothetical protein